MEILDGYIIGLLRLLKEQKDCRDVFSTLPIIYNGAFCENILQLKPKSYIIDILQDP